MIIGIEYLNVESPTKAESEDAYVINEGRNIYGVFDGSTPLTPFKDEKGHNGAYLAANLFREFFQSLSSTEDMSLGQAVIKANDLLRQKMEDYHINSAIKHHLWSTCVALVEIKPTTLEFVQLGDSMIIAGFKNGRIEVLTKDTVKNISIRAKEKRNRDRQNGLDVPDEKLFFSHIQNELIYNRSLANTPEGYSVANGMREMKDFIQYGKVKLDNIMYLLLVTDGLFFPGKGLEFTLERVIQMGLKQYSEELSRVQQEKKLKMDDKTGVFISFQ